MLVIADDLTGTLDSLSTLARLMPAEIRLQAPSDDVEVDCLGVDTETRHATPSAAAADVARQARWGRDHGFKILFKKTDSTLRGNVGAELQGLWKGAGCPGPVYFVPAFPEAGRTLQGGILYVNGRPVTETALAQDPRSPVTQSSIKALLRPWFGNGVRILGPDEFSEAGKAANNECVVFEAGTPQDLDAAVEWLMTQRDRPILLAGCGGLGRRMPRLLGIEQAGQKNPSIGMPEGPALIVHGSITPISNSQLQRALERGAPEVPIRPGQVRGSNRQMDAFVVEAVERIQACVAQGRSVILHTSGLDGIRPEAVDGMAAIKLMAQVAATALADAGIRTLFLSGGETSHAVLSAASCPGGRLLGELYPGVNRMRAVAHGRSLDIITKSGGFGPPDIYDPYLS